MKNAKISGIKLFAVTAVLAQALSIACSHREAKQADSTSVMPDSRAAAVVGAQKYVTVSFNQGQTTLRDSDKAALRSLTSQVDENRVSEILVLAWGDKEYPADGVKAASRDIRLADQRASNIKKYIQDDLDFDADVDRHNMAERPGTMAKLFRTQDFEVKNTLESTGEMPVTTAVNEPVVMDRKASSALILLKYE